MSSVGILGAKAILSVRKSPNAETDVANGFGAETLFEFSQDFGLGNLFELVVKRGLKDADIEHAFS